MTSIYVKPSPGGRVRMPERNSMPMPESGAWVPRIDFYERLLIGGDVVECDPPPPASEPAGPDESSALEPPPPPAEAPRKSRG
ncbi:DUF2635 domain-containing protein [Bradyrhizobium tropiciagri]|uniref:DUF2635 domain-containing protein n=1 Tax=Bradyrhizobium tropiciagri TaxID=312253 RepID=UPI001BA670B7|nr:DUF2635 domain-containing protein [Bradyrhizobium tropiciagri]MBR0871199.1 DUF2635 domain-containing protein [Bradyrhizobium tropiciagri]